jgi:FOG: CheY-like receiver
MLTKKLEAEMGLEVCWTESMAAAWEQVTTPGNQFAAGIVNFHLPDAPGGEIVTRLVERQIPVIVFTSVVNKEVRDRIWAEKVVDYVYKEGIQSLDYLVGLLKRLERNPKIKFWWWTIPNSNVRPSLICCGSIAIRCWRPPTVFKPWLC